MSKKHRQASKAKRQFKYQADPSTIFRVMAKTQPFTPPERDQLTLPVRSAYESLRTGAATQNDADLLAVAVNVCLVLSEDIDPLCVLAAQRAQDALMRSKARHMHTGRHGLDGEGLQAMSDCIDLHEQLLELCTPQQFTNAYNEIRERMERGEVLKFFGEEEAAA